MSQDHERIQEILAAYELHALEGDELVEAEELLATHVPGCLECRRSLDVFQAVAGDLALAGGSRRPSRMLGLRIRRSVSRQSGRRWAPVAMAAAIVIAVASLGAWNAHLSGRVSTAERRQASATKVLNAVAHPRSQVVPLAALDASFRASQLTAAFVPGRSGLYLFGSMPQPRPHHMYQVWLSRRGVFESAAVFVPDGELVLLEMAVNPLGYDGLLITEEPNHGSDRPSTRHVGTASL